MSDKFNINIWFIHNQKFVSIKRDRFVLQLYSENVFSNYSAHVTKCVSCTGIVCAYAHFQNINNETFIEFDFHNG